MSTPPRKSTSAQSTGTDRPEAEKSTFSDPLKSPLDTTPGHSNLEAELPPTIVPTPTRIGYARVSTSDGRQVTLRQEDLLTQAGCTRIFIDKISGTKSERPELQAMLDFLRPGQDEVVITSLDRLGRGGVRQILELIDRIEGRGASLRILDLDISTRTAIGTLMLSVVAQIGAIEVENIRTRVQQGVDSARARGRIGGRPPALSPAQQEEARRMHADGRQTGEIAELLGCSSRTVRRVVSK